MQAKKKSMTAKRSNRQCTGAAPRSSATILRRTLRNLKKKTQERLRQETRTAQAEMPAGKTAEGLLAFCSFRMASLPASPPALRFLSMHAIPLFSVPAGGFRSAHAVRACAPLFPDACLMLPLQPSVPHGIHACRRTSFCACQTLPSRAFRRLSCHACLRACASLPSETRRPVLWSACRPLPLSACRTQAERARNAKCAPGSPAGSDVAAYAAPSA